MSTIASTNPFADQFHSPRATPNQFSEMSSEDFLRIIFTELSNQDPFDPNDSTALLQQLNSIRSIESDMKMMNMLESLVHENQLASAATLVGKFIGGLTEDYHRVAGFVVSVIRQGNTVNLELDNGWVVPISGVETIIDPSQFDFDKPIEDPKDADDSGDADDSNETNEENGEEDSDEGNP
jgi:flagellar basal-body rod modification protein FlgD